MSQHQSKDKPQDIYKCDQVMREEPLGCIFEFVHNTLFETFWRIIEVVERDIQQYWGPQIKSDMALSEKEDFLKMQNMAMTSWTQYNNYVKIQKAVKEDFEGQGTIKEDFKGQKITVAKVIYIKPEY